MSLCFCIIPLCSSISRLVGKGLCTEFLRVLHASLVSPSSAAHYAVLSELFSDLHFFSTLCIVWRSKPPVL
eukprot:m.136884 g.136884  ORF g.136884 m.136884 type:complete len:71 (-) comp52482_c0_seq4:64-276(-)